MLSPPPAPPEGGSCVSVRGVHVTGASAGASLHASRAAPTSSTPTLAPPSRRASASICRQNEGGGGPLLSGTSSR
eukprot:scaffold27629_cov24-Tisochrysis_lutea.AAC.3